MQEKFRVYIKIGWLTVSRLFLNLFCLFVIIFTIITLLHLVLVSRNSVKVAFGYIYNLVKFWFQWKMIALTYRIFLSCESENLQKQTTHSFCCLYKYSPALLLSPCFCHSVGTHRYTAVSELGVLVRKNPSKKHRETSLLGILHTPQCRLSKTRILASILSKPRFASSPISPNPVSSLSFLT